MCDIFSICSSACPTTTEIKCNIDWLFYFINSRVVIESQGLGISPGYYECGPQIISLENRIKIEPEEIPSCLIPCLLVIFTQQLRNLSDNHEFTINFFWAKTWVPVHTLCHASAMPNLIPGLHSTKAWEKHNVGIKVLNLV